MKKAPWIAWILSFLVMAAALPFLCADCDMRAEAISAYRTQKAQDTAAGDDANAQLMALLLGQDQAAQGMTPEFPPVRFSWYGLALAGSMALGAALSLLLAGHADMKRRSGLLWGLALAMPLGLIGARALYCLCDLPFYLVSLDAPMALLKVWEGGLCLSGALFLAVLGGALGGRIAGVSPAQALHDMTPGLLIFVIGARLAEMILPAGFGPVVENALPPLTQPYNDAFRLNTALFMALAAAIILVCTLKSKRRFPMAAFLYGGTLILLESLRRDEHMLWGFVHAEMVFALITALPALLCLAGTRKRMALAMGTAILLAGAVVALEFALDRANLPDSALYAVYALVIAGWLCLGLWMNHKRTAPVKG